MLRDIIDISLDNSNLIAQFTRTWRSNERTVRKTIMEYDE